jgi:hypothetical protein
MAQDALLKSASKVTHIYQQRWASCESHPPASLHLDHYTQPLYDMKYYGDALYTIPNPQDREPQILLKVVR